MLLRKISGVAGGLVSAALVFGSGIADAQSRGGVQSGIDELAAQIVTRSVAADRTTIAISSFPHVDDSCSELSNFLVDELVLSFFTMPDNQLSIIERSQLDRIFAELELSLSGAVDINTTRELGRVHGVDTLLVGTLSTIGDDLRVNARLIDTETAQVYSAAAVNIPRTSTFEELMARPAAGGCTMRPSGARDNAAGEGRAAGRATVAPDRSALNFQLSLPDIEENFQIRALAGSWMGLQTCNSGTSDRALWLGDPTQIGLRASIYHSNNTHQRNLHSSGSLSFDMSDGHFGNRFIATLGENNILFRLISKDVLYAEFTHPETGEDCTLHLGRQ